MIRSTILTVVLFATLLIGSAAPVGAATVAPTLRAVTAQGTAPPQRIAPTQGDPAAQTTSTLPADNRDLGNSLPKPNSGATPTSSGEPGGSRQAALFWMVLVAIAVIIVLVWRSSARARSRREKAGLDPVSLAKATGKGVRGSSQTRSSTLSEPVAPSSTKRPD